LVSSLHLRFLAKYNIQQRLFPLELLNYWMQVLVIYLIRKEFVMKTKPVILREVEMLKIVYTLNTLKRFLVC